MEHIENITLEEIKKLMNITNFKVVGGAEVRMMQEFGQKFIDSSMHICGHCSGQIRFSHKRIMNFYEMNKDTIEQRRATLEAIEADKHRCLQCDTPIEDKRKKYCNDKCKKEFKKQNPSD